MGKKADTREWVAMDTWVHESERTGDVLYEAGGVYSTKPVCKWTSNARPLEPGERVVLCPSCGMRFVDAEIDDGSADENRYIHIIGSDDDLRCRVENGDAELPAICSAKRAVPC